MALFADEDKLNEGPMLRLKQSQSNHSIDIICEILAVTFRDHSCVSTPGVLQLENIVVGIWRMGEKQDGRGKLNFRKQGLELPFVGGERKRRTEVAMKKRCSLKNKFVRSTVRFSLGIDVFVVKLGTGLEG